MDKKEMKDQIFEVMLQTAVKENFEKELHELPTAKELTDDYELSESTRKEIEKWIKTANHKSTRLRMQKAAKRAAVIAAIIIPVSMVSLLSVEASRNLIFNAVMNWASDHVAIQYQDRQASSSETSSPDDSEIRPRYLPEGFVEVETDQINSSFITKYRNDQGELILFRRSSLSMEGAFSIDTEHTTRTEIEIQGEKASLFAANEPDVTSSLLWKNHSYSFLLSSKISPEELVKMAESMET
ncbi:MAG: DUF4367 domain-containing protein [Clostridium sp.]|nr:DUF4367 domain-containing protein [Clostridium sp.]